MKIKLTTTKFSLIIYL